MTKSKIRVKVQEEEEDYTLPGKPMSLETFRKLIAESENSPLLTSKEVREEIKRWGKQKSK